LLGRPRCRWDIIEMDRKETLWDGMDLFNIAQDWDKWRVVVNGIMNLRVP